MSSSIHVILVFVTICGSALGDVGFEGEDCSFDAYRKCKNKLAPYHVPGGMENVVGKLEEFCSVIHEILECTKDKLKNCASNVTQWDSNAKTAQIDYVEEVQRTVCSPEFKSKLKGVRCYTRQYKEAMIRCKADLQNVIRNDSTVFDKSSYPRKFCCAIEQYIQCASTEINRYCTPEADDTFGAVFAIALHNPKCEDYQHGTAACEISNYSYTSKGNMNRSWIWLFFPVLAVMLLQQ